MSNSTLEIVAQPGGSVVQLRLNVDTNAEPWASLLKSGQEDQLAAALLAAQQRQADLEAQVANLHEQLQAQAIQNEADTEQLYDENLSLRHSNAHLQQQNQYLLQTIEQLNEHALRQAQPVARPEEIVTLAPPVPPPEEQIVTLAPPVPEQIVTLAPPVPEQIVTLAPPVPPPAPEPEFVAAPPVPPPAPQPEMEMAPVLEPVPQQATLAAQPRPTWEPPVYSHTGEPEPDPYAGQRICNHEEDIEPDVSFGFAHSVSRFINRVQVSLGVTPDFAEVDDDY